MNYLVYLHSLGLTHKALHKIFKEDNDFKSFFDNLSFETLKRYIDNDDQILRILRSKSNLNTNLIDKKISDLGIKVIKITDKDYPEKLKQISNPPYFLYVRGNLRGDDNFFAVIGSRKMSDYARKVGESIIPHLAKHFTIVSGGAGGCDSLAHRVSVENNSKTVVIFGTGIDVTYPIGNRSLFEKVIETGGALISIFPIGTSGSVYTFPIRNEIISGMSLGVLILEAEEKSGTLITANLALDQGKDLFAVPGSIFSKNSIGTNNLIKTGQAKLVTNSADILEEYNYKVLENKKEINFENEIQESIYKLLECNLPLSIDDLIKKTSLEYGVLSTNLSLMEISGIIKKDMLGRYEISSSRLF